MNLRKSGWFFRVVLGAFAVLACVIVAALWQTVRLAKHAEMTLKRQRAELFRLRSAAQHAPPLAALEAEIKAVVAQREEARERLRPRGRAAQRHAEQLPPASAAEAYFELAEFQARMRERARRSGVQVGEDQGFGFARYRHAGPAPAAISAVFEQRLIVEHLLELLFAAGPRNLLRVRRESIPADGSEVALPGLARNDADEAPQLLGDPSRSSRVSDLASTRGFELVFTGDTAALRRLLNAFASSELPLVVRGVEVGRAAAPDAIPRTVAGFSAGEPGLSLFTVAVECVELQTESPELN